MPVTSQLLHRSLRKQLVESRTRLYRLAFSWCHQASVSDDLVQEALTKALAKLHQLRDPEALNAWLCGILSNCWRDYLRKTRHIESIDDLVLVEHQTPEHLEEKRYLADKVRRAVAELPQGQRMVVTLVDLQGASYREVAEILSIPVGTVMSRLCRARNTLASKLSAYVDKGQDNVHALRMKS